MAIRVLTVSLSGPHECTGRFPRLCARIEHLETKRMRTRSAAMSRGGAQCRLRFDTDLGRECFA